MGNGLRGRVQYNNSPNLKREMRGATLQLVVQTFGDFLKIPIDVSTDQALMIGGYGLEQEFPGAQSHTKMGEAPPAIDVLFRKAQSSVFDKHAAKRDEGHFLDHSTNLQKQSRAGEKGAKTTGQLEMSDCDDKGWTNDERKNIRKKRATQNTKRGTTNSGSQSPGRKLRADHTEQMALSEDDDNEWTDEDRTEMEKKRATLKKREKKGAALKRPGGTSSIKKMNPTGRKKIIVSGSAKDSTKKVTKRATLKRQGGTTSIKKMTVTVTLTTSTVTVRIPVDLFTPRMISQVPELQN
jgi:hypothetical protein